MASASVVLAYGFGVFHLLKVMDGVRELVKAMSRYKDYREAATRQSNAELATVEQFESAGLLGEHGIVLGSISDQAGKKRLLKYDGKNAITVASPPEGKKSTSVFMPTLLATAEGRGLGHSAIVFDPAAEIYSVTQEALRKENDVYCLSPWPERIAAQLLEATGEEIPVHDSGLNYWSDLNIEDEDPRQFRSVLKRKAELLIPCNPRDDEKDRFFKMAGRRLFIYFALYCIAAEKAPTLAMIRSMLNEGPEAMQKRFAEGSESTALNGLLAEEAGGLLDIASGAVEQHAGGLGNALNAIDLFDGYSVFADHFRPDGLDPGVLKREKPAIVFVIYPLELIESHKQAINLTLSHLFEQIAMHPRRDLRVTALIDEMASLGYMPNLLAAMNQYRKFGLRIVAALQDAYGQTEQNYGSSGVKQILGVSEFIWASNISEPNMLDMLSKMSGETTITDASLSDTQNPQHRDATSQQYSWSHKSRPLLRPDEIRRLPAHQVVLLGRNMPAGIINKTPYWTHPEWKQLAGPNPSHRE